MNKYHVSNERIIHAYFKYGPQSYYKNAIQRKKMVFFYVF